MAEGKNSQKHRQNSDRKWWEKIMLGLVGHYKGFGFHLECDW